MDHHHDNDDEFDNNMLFFCNAIEQCADYFMEAMKTATATDIPSSSESTTTTTQQDLLLRSINNLLQQQNQQQQQMNRFLLIDENTIEGESRGYADDATWILTASFVILTMQSGFVVYCIYSFVSTIFYSFAAHWLFASNGWLNQLGAHDFAGGASVHIFGGINGLVAILFLGPRRGRFDGTKPISDFFPSSPTSQVFGLFMLWWGWIGFNCGSSFGITDDKWVVAIRCAVTTINSTVGGGSIAIIYSLWRTDWRLIIPEHVVNGILGSLVAITPACASVRTYDAFPIGLIGGLVGLGINTLLCHLKLDDPVGAIGVHAGGGIWGMISVGLFADSQLPGIDVQDGLFRSGGDWSLLGYQLIAILSIIGWAATWSSIFFYLVGCGFSRNYKNPRIGLRQNAKEDERGADWYLHGVVDQLALEEYASKATEHESDHDDDDHDDHDDDDMSEILSFTGYNDDVDTDDDNDSFDIHHQVPPSSPPKQTTATKKHPHRKQLLTRKSDMYYRSSLEKDFQPPRHIKRLNLAFLDNSDRSRSSSVRLSGSERSSSNYNSRRSDNNNINRGRRRSSATTLSTSEEKVEVISRNPHQHREESAPFPPPPPTTTTVSSPPRTTTRTTAATINDDTSNNNNNNLRRHSRGSNSIDRMLGQNRSSSRMMMMVNGRDNNNNNNNEPSPQRQLRGRGGGLSGQSNSRNLSKELRIYR